MVPVVYFCLPNSASTAAFLTEREREITVARSVQDGNTGQGEKLNWRNVGEGLKDPKAWIQALSKFRGFVARCIVLTGVPTSVLFDERQLFVAACFPSDDPHRDGFYFVRFSNSPLG